MFIRKKDETEEIKSNKKKAKNGVQKKKIKRPEEKLPWGRYIPYTSPTGKKTVLYNIDFAAQAIGRRSPTLRMWEIKGIIPPTPFRQHNKRLYSKEHIDCLVKYVEKHKVIMGKPMSKAFCKNVYKEFQRINDYFFKEDYGDDTVREEESKMKVE